MHLSASALSRHEGETRLRHAAVSVLRRGGTAARAAAGPAGLSAPSQAKGRASARHQSEWQQWCAQRRAASLQA